MQPRNLHEEQRERDARLRADFVFHAELGQLELALDAMLRAIAVGRLVEREGRALHVAAFVQNSVQHAMYGWLHHAASVVREGALTARGMEMFFDMFIQDLHSTTERQMEAELRGHAAFAPLLDDPDAVAREINDIENIHELPPGADFAYYNPVEEAAKSAD